MGVLDTASLARTLDRVNDAFFFGRPPSRAEGARAARWIASRQGVEGSYGGMFAPTKADFRSQVSLFTGEKLVSNVGRSHILGEEASRAVILLDTKIPEVDAALDRSTQALLGRLAVAGGRAGTFCCATCSVSLWRHMAARDTAEARRLLAEGLADLRRHRDGAGRWRRYPFYYTVLALDGVRLPAAREERRYAAPVLARTLERAPRRDRIGVRRAALAERVLAAD